MGRDGRDVGDGWWRDGKRDVGDGWWRDGKELFLNLAQLKPWPTVDHF